MGTKDLSLYPYLRNKTNGVILPYDPLFADPTLFEGVFTVDGSKEIDDMSADDRVRKFGSAEIPEAARKKLEGEVETPEQFNSSTMTEETVLVLLDSAVKAGVITRETILFAYRGTPTEIHDELSEKYNTEVATSLALAKTNKELSDKVAELEATQATAPDAVKEAPLTAPKSRTTKPKKEAVSVEPLEEIIEGV